MKKDKYIKIGKNKIGDNFKTYFIADIAANHDGSLKRAKKLIKLAAQNGADAAKFQHFKAETIVSDKGFKSLGRQLSHQAKWKKNVFEVYKDASIPFWWTGELKKTCKKYKIDFFTSPYDLDYVDEVDKFIPAFKIGSGDITWLEILEKIAKKNKPCILATGASTFKDVDIAVKQIKKFNKKLMLMQCNTNYTGNDVNNNYLNLKVILEFKKKYPDLIVGLSDHTKDDQSVLSAVAMGARIVEKHFTDNNNRQGPDHWFSMNPKNWRKMILNTRKLEKSLGDGLKKIEKNEINTVVLQRRSLRLTNNLRKGHILKKKDLISLRPCPKGSISPQEITKVIGKKLKKNMFFHDCIKWKNLK